MCLSGPYLSVDVNHVPGVLELADVVVTEQSVLLVGVEEREVLHDDGCNNTGTVLTSSTQHTLLD